MRDYTGVPVQAVKDPTMRVNVVAPIDYFLRDLSRAMGRIQKGQVPDGSGKPIGDQILSDIYLVLKGRVGNQVAHGGTLAGGSLTLASTLNPTKGKVYLGDAQTTAYDEVNDRLGLNQTTPLAKLHIKVPDPAGVSAVPVSYNGGANIDWGNVGGASNYDTALSDTSDATLARWTDGTGFASSITLSLTNGLVNPGTTSGFSIDLRARSTDTSTNSRIELDLYGTTGGVVRTIFIAGPNHNVANGAFDIQLTASMAPYSIPLTSGQATSMFNGTHTQPFTVVLGNYSGAAGVGVYEFAKLTLQLPAAGGGSAEPLQKWQSATNANSLDYALDGNSQQAMVFSGNRIAVSAALAITVGSPASGMIGTSTDTIGTYLWASASGLATKVEHRWVANGYYRVDNDVDGAWIAPHAMTIGGVTAYRRAAGTGGTTSLDVLKNGVTVLSSMASVGATGGASATGAGTLSVTTLAVGDRITVSANAVETGRPQDWVLTLEAY